MKVVFQSIYRLRFVAFALFLCSIWATNAAADVTLGSSEEPTTATPNPTGCTNPTAKLSDGTCGPNKIEIASACSATYANEHRCIDVPPDSSAGYPTNYIPDCSPNDADSCKACVWKKPDCSVYNSLKWTLGSGYEDLNVFSNINQIVRITSGSSACVQKMVNDVNAAASAKSGGNRYWDDWVYFNFMFQFGINPHAPDYNLVDCQQKGDGSWGHYASDCIAGTIYFNAATCRVAPVSVVKSICSKVTVAIKDLFFPSSPISLLWEKNTDVESNVSFTQFPLDPRHPGNWYLWKASSKAPLLVFDPEHKGQITSADQLFGNWTFGGKRLASLSLTPALLGETNGTPWKNGYEALRTLDQNNDGVISGKELEPLALWFDDNQDAVVQPGEIKRLDEVGVTALSVQSDSVDPITGNVSASFGYERRVDGKAVRGASVDWFSKGATTPGELYSIYGIKSLIQATAPAAKTGAEINVPNVNEAPSAAAAIASASTFSGAWSWRYDDARIKVSRGVDQGVLFLNETSDGKVEGTSISELPMSSPNKQLGSVAFFTRLEGTKSLSKDGSLGLAFRLLSDDAKSTATISPNGKLLSGETTEIFHRAGKSDLTVHYRWSAEKIAGN